MQSKEQALISVREENRKLKITAFDMLLNLVRGSIPLQHAGYKSIEQAANLITIGTMAQINRNILKFERDYPDDDDGEFE